MPRIARQVVPGVPLHVTHRGLDRRPTFARPQDFAYFRWALREAAADAACAVHAYVLMTNHVHLLITPADVTGPSRMMRSLGARYVPYFNAHEHRSGALWAGRYRATLVDRVGYLFACSRYIELNPVRAGMVESPDRYAWSSFHRNARGLEDPIVTMHPTIAELGTTDQARCAAYRALFAIPLDENVVAAIRATRRSRGRPRESTGPVALPPDDPSVESGAGPLGPIAVGSSRSDSGKKGRAWARPCA